MNPCVFCGKKIQRELSLGWIFSYQKMSEPWICIDCKEKFVLLEHKKTCVQCFRKQDNQEVCQDCRKWEKKPSQMKPQHTAIYSYNEMAKEYMNQFKFQGDLLLGELFMAEIQAKLKPYQKTHHIVPIPLSHFGKRTRGFNQVEVLLQNAGINYQNLLRQVGGDKKQSSKNRRERLELKQPFERLVAKTERMEKPVLIVDDVYTTGQTIFYARALFNQETPTESFSLFR